MRLAAETRAVFSLHFLIFRQPICAMPFCPKGVSSGKIGERRSVSSTWAPARRERNKRCLPPSRRRILRSGAPRAIFSVSAIFTKRGGGFLEGFGDFSPDEG
jgi:hypothetical protein